MEAAELREESKYHRNLDFIRLSLYDDCSCLALLDCLFYSFPIDDDSIMLCDWNVVWTSTSRLHTILGIFPLYYFWSSGAFLFLYYYFDLFKANALRVHAGAKSFMHTQATHTAFYERLVFLTMKFISIVSTIILHNTTLRWRSHSNDFSVKDSYVIAI